MYRSFIENAPEMPTGYCETRRFTDMLRARYGARVSVLGKTVCGRDIPLLTLGDGGAERAVIYVASHHATEWICTPLLLLFSRLFLSSRRQSDTAVFVVPMLNCDGVELHLHGGGDFSRWQANANGVDLNHNYDAGFYEYKKIERRLGITGGCASRFSGERPESEPETAALASFIRSHRGIKGAITLHTQGEEIYCGSPSCPESVRLGREAERITGYKLSVPDEEAALYGGMTDYLTEKLRIPSLTVECGKGRNPLPASAFPGICERVLPLLFSFPDQAP